MTHRNSSRSTVLLCAGVLVSGFSLFGLASAQSRSVPEESGGSRLERDFASPPAAARPWVYWFVMDGNFTREGITADLEAMRRAGIGGLIFMEVNVGIPRGPVAFMSPEWQDLWRHAVRESERLGIQLTLNGGPGWTGSGGPWVQPALSMQLITSAELNVTGPQTFSGVLPRPANRSKLTDYYRDVRVLAFPRPSGNERIADVDQKSFLARQSTVSGGGSFSLPSYSSSPPLPVDAVVDPRRTIDLTDRMDSDGRLRWDVPPGEWTILRFGATNNGASTLPAPASGVGMESDKFSQAGLDAHFRDFIGPLLRTVGPRVVAPDRGWNNLHIDSWEVGTQNWTPTFVADFRRRRGYDPLPYLPALSGYVVGSLDASNRFLWDWRQTCQELVVVNHVAHFKTVAARNGFGLSIEPYDKVMASDMSLGAPADVPMGEFWGYDPPPETLFSVFEAASIAHTNGRKIVGAESFTSGPSERWKAFPGNMKGLGDWALTAGINRFVFHRYQHQPDLDKAPGMTMGPFGIHWERTQTWWDLAPAYHGYLARCQGMLREGIPVSDVCYLVAEGAPQVFRAPASATQGDPPEFSGYRFDACAPEVVLNRMAVRNGLLRLPDGTSYRILVLPDPDTMTPTLLRKLSKLVAAGATIVGPRPRTSPSLSGGARSDATVARLAAALWGDCDGVRVTEHRFGKGHVLWHRGAEGDLSRPQPSPVRDGRWIWSPEGAPATSAPVGKRAFRRTIEVEDAAQLASARITLTADNSFELSVDEERVGGGDDWRKFYTFDLANRLKSGRNRLSILAENGDDTPNPAGLIAVVRLQYRDGRVVEIPTDALWEASSNEGAAWTPALVLGRSNIGPWNLPSSVPGEQYGDFSVVSDALRSMNVPVDFESNGPIRSIHRLDGNTDIYFVANRGERLLNADCTFRVAGKTPELWDPLTGERRTLTDFSEEDGRTVVPLRFEPQQSWFVVFRPTKDRGESAPNFPTLRVLGQLDSPWQVSFDPRWGGPAQTVFPTLSDWSQNPDAGIRYYSGKAVYRQTFLAPSIPSDAPVYLDLGTVRDMAQVRVNGQDVGTVWCAPWRVEVSRALHPGENQVEITVANRWPNRLIGDKRLPEDKRLASTTWNPFRADDPLLPSGLLGPVTLVASGPRSRSLLGGDLFRARGERFATISGANESSTHRLGCRSRTFEHP